MSDSESVNWSTSCRGWQYVYGSYHRDWQYVHNSYPQADSENVIGSYIRQRLVVRLCIVLTSDRGWQCTGTWFLPQPEADSEVVCIYLRQQLTVRLCTVLTSDRGWQNAAGAWEFWWSSNTSCMAQRDMWSSARLPPTICRFFNTWRTSSSP